QCVDLGVGLAVAFVPPLADQLPLADHDGADQGVRLNRALAALGQFQGALHPRPVCVVHANLRPAPVSLANGRFFLDTEAVVSPWAFYERRSAWCLALR